MDDRRYERIVHRLSSIVIFTNHIGMLYEFKAIIVVSGPIVKFNGMVEWYL